MAVFALGGRLKGDAGPVHLTPAGATLNALLLSLATGVVLICQDSLEILRFWVAGSLSQATVRPLFEMACVAALGPLDRLGNYSSPRSDFPWGSACAWSWHRPGQDSGRNAGRRDADNRRGRSRRCPHRFFRADHSAGCPLLSGP
ncbi:MAG: hypothetical protein GYB27_01995 [Rhodobacteraceae bacterium]|nr:hypothetical protein [Paracoccaceae bacterium]